MATTDETNLPASPPPKVLNSRNPDSTATPAGMTWQDAGIARRAPASDPISDIYAMSDNVALAARESGLPGVHNGPADAYRHALWTARMTKKYGSLLARGLGVAHELHGIGKSIAKGESPAWRETAMDLANNERGIQMASDPSFRGSALWWKIKSEAAKTKIPKSYDEAFAEAVKGNLVALPPGVVPGSDAAKYVEAFNRAGDSPADAPEADSVQDAMTAMMLARSAKPK